MSSGKLQNKTTDGVVQSRKAAPPTSAEQDPLAVQQLADPLSDPLTDSSTVYGGGPSSMVDSAGSPGGDPTQFNGGQGSGDIQSIARSGIGGGGGSLPHLDTIQKSFGGHDLSGVQSHVGGKAASANKAMGSSAYATSNHVAFKSSPDLHTAAHEAAHVVQQRTGVSVPGGVGQAGDRYEKHADSVANALARVKSDIDFVAVHDAARPCLANEWIDRVFEAAEKSDAAILAIPVRGTVKRVSKGGIIEETMVRENLWEAQTPQVFRRQLLLDAYAQQGDLVATDEAQLVEQMGHPVTVVHGSPINLKITTKEDLRLAQQALNALPKPKLLGPVHPFADDDMWR